jgi:hypothetical protein
MATGRSANAKRIVLLVWILVAFFYFYLSYDYIHASMNDRQFADYLHYVVQIAGNDRRSAKDIRDLLMVKAEELSLPLDRNQIRVNGGGDSLNIVVNYDLDIEIPLIQRQVYTKTFAHNVKYQGPR